MKKFSKANPMGASSCKPHGHGFLPLPVFHSAVVVALLLTLFLPLGLVCLPHVNAELSRNPSTRWNLSDYYDDTLLLSAFAYRNFVVCNNSTAYVELLNSDEGLYGRPTNIRSSHYIVGFSVYFRLYFVISAASVCSTDVNPNVEPAYYLSMVATINMLQKTPDPNAGHIVWTANTQEPVSKNACLELGEDSNLKLVEYSHNEPKIVWQTNTFKKTVNVSLAITFEGNLALFSNTTDPPFSPLWESHRHPTNTLMVLQVLQQNNTLSFRSNVSSSEPDDLKNYTMTIENGRIVLYAQFGQQGDPISSPYGSRYWVSPVDSSVARNTTTEFWALCWDPIQRLRVSAVPNTVRSAEISPETCSDITETILEFPDPNPTNLTYATFVRLDADGDLRAYTVDNAINTDSNSDAIWRAFYSVFNSSPCDLPLYCGFYGMCHQQMIDGSHCACNNTDFEFVDEADHMAGCKLTSKPDSERKLWYQTKQINDSSRHLNGSSCPINDESISACATNKSGCSIQFLQMENVYYFSLSFDEPEHHNTTQTGSDFCKQICLRDCTCTVAFWNQQTTQCFLIRGQVGTIQQGVDYSMVAFVKFINVEIEHPVNTFHWILLGSVLSGTLLIVALGIFAYIYKQRRAIAYRMREFEQERLLLLPLLDGNTTERFSWKQMQEYTCGFSDLLGRGGFGRVFRGSLPDGTAIAVKQLDEDRSQGQGNKEFIMEVSILSRIHHAHLVRLTGFCLEGSHRLLAYEYMENGSLDAWLLEPPPPLHHVEKKNVNGKGLLTWKTRLQIAVGASKGLAYLHEECEERVIHMDFKPQNILLGRNFTPKISDFGMSRRTARGQTSVMTVMRGTPGYLAPEWLLDCAVTEKCDVYGFGIVLLELVSGRKVKDLKAVKQKLSMRPLRESVVLDYLDEKLKYSNSDVKEEEAVRMVEVALLCVRKDPAKRPAMSRVALMLEGKEEVQLGDTVDEDDGDGDDAEQLVLYPSTINKSMRIRRRSFNLDDLTGSRSWFRNKYDRSFHGDDSEKAANDMEMDSETNRESDLLINHHSQV